MDKPRGGSRGGRDSFEWDKVKEDKHRTNYLGNSIKAPVGRWQVNKDLHWYAKKSTREEEREKRRQEIKGIKERETQLLKSALTHGVGSGTVSKNSVTRNELMKIKESLIETPEDEFKSTEGLGSLSKRRKL